MVDNFNIDPKTPQRVAIVIEKNKSETWSVGCYLVTADGARHRHNLGAFDTYSEAADRLRKSWEDLKVSKN